MSCCGRRRQAFKAHLIPRPIRLRFIGEGEIDSRGPFTGKLYQVNDSHREIEVDPRDAHALIQDGRFQPA